jgi:hypothetical protein
MFTLEEVEKKLVVFQERLQVAREGLFLQSEAVINARIALKDEEAYLIASGKIDATNETGRKGQLATFTEWHRKQVDAAETQERAARHLIETCRLNYELAVYMLRIAEVNTNTVNVILQNSQTE